MAVDPTLVVTPSPVNILEGATQQLTVTGTNGALTFESNDTDVATVSSTGLITAVAEGTTTIDITSAATADYNAGSTSVTVNVSAAAAPKTLPYENTLISSHTDFTFNIVSAGGLASVWSDSSYGMQANGNKCTSNIEAYAESPEIDLTSVSGAKLSFTHGINFFADVATAKTQATLEVKVKNGSWSAVTIPSYPSSLGNSTVSTDVDLNSYAGKIIQFRFKYLATTSNPGRWQIKNLSVTEVVPPATHTITINQPASGGTIAATVDAVAINDGDEVEEGKTVVLTAEPASGYEFSEWSVTGATAGNVTNASTSFTVGDSDVTVTASFIPESTANAYTYIFTSNAWAATREGNAENWTSGAAGNSLNATQGLQITSAKSGANGTSKYGFTDVEQVVVVYSTNASSGAGSIAVKVGNGTEKSLDVTSAGGTTDRELKFNYSPKESGNVKVTVTCTSNSIYVKSVTVKAAEINLPIAYNITCATGLSHGSVSVAGNATTAYAGDAVSISANPDSGYELEAWDVYKTGDSSTKVEVTNNSFTMPSYDVTVTASFVENEGSKAWHLVTDATSLSEDDLLVLVCESENAAAGNIASQIMGSVSVTISSHTISSLPSGVVQLTLGGTSGAWTLANGSGQLLGATAAKKLAWDSGTTTWSISITDGNATVTNGTASYGNMQYNSGSPRFTTYTSSQTAIQLYRYE